MKIIDLLITYNYQNVNTFEKRTYKNIIDKNNKVLRKSRTLSTAKEKDNYTLLHTFSST